MDVCNRLTNALFLKAGWTSRSKGSGSCLIETCVRASQSITHVPIYIFAPPPQPKLKEKTLARHEFSGNRPLTGLSSSAPSRGRSHGGMPDAQPARGRGEGGRGRRGQNRGRGRGRGATTGPGTEGGTASGDGGDARSHNWKNKNKARQGNHDRKRGHDRKMGKAGGPSG